MENLFIIEVTWNTIVGSILVLALVLIITVKTCKYLLRHRIILERENTEKPLKVKNDYLLSLFFINPFRTDEIEKEIKKSLGTDPLIYINPGGLEQRERERVWIYMNQIYFLSVKKKLGDLGNRDAAFETFFNFNHSILKGFDKFINSDERYKIKSLTENKIKSLPVGDLKLFKFDHLVGINIEEMEIYRQNILQRNTLHELSEMVKKLGDFRINGEADAFLNLALKIIDFLKNNEIKDKESFTREAFKIQNCLLDEINYYKAKSEKSDDATKLTILFNYREWLDKKIKQEPIALITKKTE